MYARCGELYTYLVLGEKGGISVELCRVASKAFLLFFQHTVWGWWCMDTIWLYASWWGRRLCILWHGVILTGLTRVGMEGVGVVQVLYGGAGYSGGLVG